MDTRIELQHTSSLNREARQRLRALLEVAFEGDFAESDWGHTIGGMHALAWEAGALIGHGSVVQRQLVYQGRALRCGYVEALAVLPERQRRGVGDALMAELERIIRASYEVGALGASEAGIALYEKRGWKRWRGRTLAFTPDGIVPTPEDDSVYVLEVSAPLDVEADLICDYREGDVW